MGKLLIVLGHNTRIYFFASLSFNFDHSFFQPSKQMATYSFVHYKPQKLHPDIPGTALMSLRTPFSHMGVPVKPGLYKLYHTHFIPYTSKVLLSVPAQLKVLGVLFVFSWLVFFTILKRVSGLSPVQAFNFTNRKTKQNKTVG